MVTLFIRGELEEFSMRVRCDKILHECLQISLLHRFILQFWKSVLKIKACIQFARGWYWWLQMGSGELVSIWAVWLCQPYLIAMSIKHSIDQTKFISMIWSLRIWYIFSFYCLNCTMLYLMLMVYYLIILDCFFVAFLGHFISSQICLSNLSSYTIISFSFPLILRSEEYLRTYYCSGVE